MNPPSEQSSSALQWGQILGGAKAAYRKLFGFPALTACFIYMDNSWKKDKNTAPRLCPVPKLELSLQMPSACFL